MIRTTFNQIAYGSYFRSVFTNALFVKHNSTDAAAIKLNGQRDEHEYEYEFDATTEILACCDESEWPTIDYTEQIRDWDWGGIKKKAASNISYDESDDDDQPKATAWLGTTLGVMPSGKIYAMWTSNQTAEDVNRDQQFAEAMEIVFGEQKMFIDWGDSGDLFASKWMSWEEIAKASGYHIEEDHGRFSWGGPEVSEVFSDDEESAWKDCCISNKLVGVV